jgi:hypothetical protein
VVTQLIFPSKTIFKIELNLQWQKLLKIQYRPHLKSKNFQITFIKSYSLKAFQIPQYFFWFKWIFNENKYIPLLVKTLWNQCGALLFTDDFPTIPIMWYHAPRFGRFQNDKLTKQNKQTTFNWKSLIWNIYIYICNVDNFCKMVWN